MRISSYLRKTFWTLFAISFGSLSISFAILHYGLNWQYSIALLYRMYGYPIAHPFQYIGLVSLVFSVVGAFWVCNYSAARGWKRWRGMSAVMLITILISSPLGGILWQIHDMYHGFIPESHVIQSKISEGIGWGIQLGWLIVLLSFPLNAIALIVGYSSLHKLGKL